MTVAAQWVTVVAQWAKAPGIHYYVAGSIPAVTPRYCTKKIEKCSLEQKKQMKKKHHLYIFTVFQLPICPLDARVCNAQASVNKSAIYSIHMKMNPLPLGGDISQSLLGEKK